MNVKVDPTELAEALISRSTCYVKVAAVIEDAHGVLSWGWNSVGEGFGKHAEAHAIERANKKRLEGATIYVAGTRKRNLKPVNSTPCEECMKLINKWGITDVWFRDNDNVWKLL
jgi:deoxycytidylate deaminase